MQRAQGAGLDLVEVAGKSEPPVCRIMDYGKFQYQQSKRQREAKKKQHLQKLKEVKFHPNIDPHDYQIKLNRIIAFVEKGFRVKVSMYFRGREMAHTDIGMHLMQQVAEDTAEVANTDVRPRRSGRMLLLMLSPKAH